MELRHLRYFITVAEELNFSKAALKLFTAQPSLSQQIKDLEEEIGVRLFNRTKRKVELTEEGSVFLEQARLTMAQAERAVAMARQAHLAKQQILRIGFITAAEIRIFPKILPTFRIQHPTLKIEQQILHDLEQHKALKKGDLDIIFSRQQIEAKNIKNHVVFKDELALILPKQHPLAQLERIPVKELEKLNFIVPTSNTFAIMNQAVSEFLQAHHLHLNVHTQTQNIVDSLALINSGVGCAILPKYVDPFSSLPNLAVRPLEIDLPTLDLIVSYRTDTMTQPLKEFIEILAAAFPLH